MPKKKAKRKRKSKKSTAKKYEYEWSRDPVTHRKRYGPPCF